MSPPVDCLPKVYREIETIPLDHKHDAPVVALFDEKQWNRHGPCPKAVIFTLDKGERIADKPRYCICIFNEDNGISFSDGFYAIESKDTIAVSAVLFPVLCEALRIVPREYANLIPTKSTQAPHMLVEAAHNGTWNIGDDPDMISDGYGATAILMLLIQWDEMNSKNWGWRKRAHSVLGKKPTPDTDDAQTDRFPKFCRKIGLDRKDKRDFKRELAGLWAAYRETQQ
jgi:hypothetical protein